MNPAAGDDRTGLSPLASIRRFVRPRAVRERCDLCDAPLGDQHAHLIEAVTGRLACACDACAILFSGSGSPQKYRRVPRRAAYLADFRLSDEAWDALQLPIALAYFVPRSAESRVVAYYPSPAGATEALVPPEAWQGLEAENPVLRAFEPDVEALLVNRVGAANDAYRVGIDVCYELVGLIRTHWRGLSGGPAVWGEIGQFFAGLKERVPHA